MTNTKAVMQALEPSAVSKEMGMIKCNHVNGGNLWSNLEENYRYPLCDLMQNNGNK